MTDLNFVPDELSELSWEELLEHFDNPKNFNIPDIALQEIKNLEANSFPKHATVLLTHGLFAINSEDRKAVVKQVESVKDDTYNILSPKKRAYRLLSNFSDVWTRKVAKYMFIESGDEWYSKENSANDNEAYEYPENIIIPGSPRIKWDPARATDAKDFKRRTDFNENELLPEFYGVNDNSWEESHEIYHTKIPKRLTTLEKNGKRSITFDIHDTGVRLEDQNPEKDTFRPWGYPKMEIGTLDGSSCDPEILAFFVEQVEKYFGFSPVVNQKYKWGYVTKKHGWEARKSLEEAWENPNKRNVLQIELGRYLYMKESTQEIDHEQARKVWAALRMCIQKTWEKFWEDFQNAA